MRPLKIISGGQTGVDRAGLDAAREAGLPVGGWCPLGRLAEDGAIPTRYPLQETPTADYEERTTWNVRDADATLILLRGEPTLGTAFTIERARELDRPLLVQDVRDPQAAEAVRGWLAAGGYGTLNVAGPRESGAPGIYTQALALLRRVFAGLLRPTSGRGRLP